MWSLYPSVPQCVFPRNMEILLHNHSTVIKIREFTFHAHYCQITDHSCLSQKKNTFSLVQDSVHNHTWHLVFTVLSFHPKLFFRGPDIFDKVQCKRLLSWGLSDASQGWDLGMQFGQEARQRRSGLGAPDQEPGMALCPVSVGFTFLNQWEVSAPLFHSAVAMFPFVINLSLSLLRLPVQDCLWHEGHGASFKNSHR